jgi:nitroimidazol reductase NimA-like FMN-containing flavoprotein (pyridoxamine 5'-phosphate oxidase superfamily)
LRRKDKEIKDKKTIESIIKRATVCRIGLAENDIPYIVPMNFGYKDNCLYFHSAPVGKKIEIIKKNNNVCFEIDIAHEILQGKSACHTTMKYYSVIGYGKAYIIDDSEEKIKALNIIIEHYLPEIPHEYSEKFLKKIVIIKVEIDNMTGKKSGY